MICRRLDNDLNELLGRFKSYTSKMLLREIESSGNESRKEWLLQQFHAFAKSHKQYSDYHVWQYSNYCLLYTSMCIRDRPEGIVTALVKRSQESFEGTVHQNKTGFYFRPLENRIRKIFHLDDAACADIREGQRVIARILRWKQEHGKPDAEIVEVLSNQSMSDIEMKRILIQNGFHIDFPSEVMQECAATVSYTHLDVYKRQLQYCCVRHKVLALLHWKLQFFS